MNKRRITIIVSIICALFLLSGCSTSNELITPETTFSDMKSDGILSCILVYPLSQAINILSLKTGVFWAITIVASALNALVIILTFKSNVSMQRMQELQPEMQKIQLKYEGRKDQASQMRMSSEMQQLYKKYDINPIGSLVSTFIQLPILFAMYSAVRRSIAVANGTFLGVSLSLTPTEAFTSKAWILIVIYVLMIASQFLSMSVTRWISEARKKKEAERRHKHYEKAANPQGFMSYGMLLFIGFIMLSWPTALSLYYLIFSVINIIKAFIIDAITHKNEED